MSSWTDYQVTQFFASLANPLSGALSANLTTGGAITSLPVVALPQALPAGAPVLLSSSGGSSQWWLTTAPAALGATSITVASQTPNFAYQAATTVLTSPLWGTASPYLGLHYGNPSLGGLGMAELTGGSYARQPLSVSVVNSRAVYNTNAILFTGLNATQVAFLGVWDAVTAGNLRAYIAVLPAATVVGGGQFPVNVGDLALTF